MKFSFVIPAHNEEQWIGACLDAVLGAIADGRHDVEIIVVNNASTDGTRRVAERYPGVRVIDEPQKGTNRARQTGFAASTGDLIANIDADTLISRAWLRRAVRAFAMNPRLAAISGPYQFADISPLKQVMIALYYLLLYPLSLVAMSVGRGAFMIGGNVVIRRTALEAAGGYNTAITFYGDDTDTALRLRRVGLVRFDYRLTASSSIRRLVGEGLFATGWQYILNYLWVTLFGTPYTKTAKDVRRNSF